MKTTFEELFAFHTVADTGSITVAVEQLGQTVSDVGRVLCRLEEKLDTILLSCTTRWLSLTGEGVMSLMQARRILAVVDEAEEQIALRRQQPTGRLCVSVAMPSMLHVVAPLVSSFCTRYPQIELELNTNDLIIDLLEEDTDVVIRIGTLRDSAPRACLLGTRRLRVLASPAYLKMHGRPRHVDDPQKHALPGSAQPESLNRRPLRGPYGDHLCIELTLKALSGEAPCQLAPQGVDIVCLVDLITMEDRRAGDLVQVLPDAAVEVLQPIHAVYYRNTQLASRTACSLDFLEARSADDKQ